MNESTLRKLASNPFYKMSKKQKEELAKLDRPEMQKFGNVFIHNTDSTKKADKIVRTKNEQK